MCHHASTEIGPGLLQSLGLSVFGLTAFAAAGDVVEGEEAHHRSTPNEQQHREYRVERDARDQQHDDGGRMRTANFVVNFVAAKI